MMRNRDIDDLICRFVVDGSGNSVGESVAVYEDILIIKSKDKFLGVPLKHVEILENYIRVRGLISIDKAEELGRAWEERYAKERRV